MSSHEESLPPHEEALVRAFIHPRRREQFLSRLASPRTRRKLLDQLAHFRDLDPRFARRIPPGERTADKVYRRLKGLGAPATCYVLGSGELDGREIDLREALEAIVSQSFGDFLSCIPGRLGYFEGEEADERYILER